MRALVSKSQYAFPDVLLKPSLVADALRPFGIGTFYQAVSWVWMMPYGRNSDRSDYMLVAKEQRGACSAKHAFLAKLAQEQSVDLILTIGIFMMDADNTPAISNVLKSSVMKEIPEAHCYLKYRDKRYDFTSYKPHTEPVPRLAFLYEEAIKPEQIGDYKVALHQKWLKNWLVSNPNVNMDFEEVWSIRERCITALAETQEII
jgi:hypothetical protein